MINEKLIIEQCALTLSGLKSASLFSVRFDNKNKLYSDVSFWSEKFSAKGIEIKMLKSDSNTALIYVYRKNMLENDINNLKAKEILLQFGYSDFNVASAINMLSNRLHKCSEFPHEIGLFLGYPPKDVEGFICNSGKNCAHCRYWKVYGNEEEALKKFAKFDKCRSVYRKLWQEGRDILQLTVNKRVAV